MTCPNCGALDQTDRFCRRCGATLNDEAGHTVPPPGRAQQPASPTPSGPTQRSRLVTYGVGCLAVIMAACVAFLLVASVPDPVALALSVGAAVVPAALYAFLVVQLDRYEAEPRRLILASFGWGAVGAILFSVIAGLVFQALIITAVTEDGSAFLSAAIGAPLIEETFKGIALVAILLLFRHELDNVLDGLVYGALIGLGFAMTENVLYFGKEYLDNGVEGLGRLFVARAVLDGFGHAAYTATTGAAIGWARQQYRQGAWRFVVPVVGWGLAVLQHFLWNAGIFVIAGLQGEGASVLSVVLIEAPLFILPAVIVLFLIARTASRRELRIIREQLADEVEAGVLTPAEYQILSDDGLRRRSLRDAAPHGGRALRDRQRRFFHVAAELAFRKYHLSRGEQLKPGQQAPEDAYREELAALRSDLPTAAIPATVDSAPA